MGVEYIIDNSDASLVNQSISGNLSVIGSISGNTFYGDGSNLTGITAGGSFTGGTVSGATTFTNGLNANAISATTYLNLPSFSGGTTFTGGTVSGATTFTNGLSADTIYSPSFIGDGSQLGGIVGLTYSQMGFTITSPAPSTINQNVVLPYNSTATYPTPLTISPGFSVTVPSGTTLTIV